MALRALVTSIGGFAAGHLVRCLVERGLTVYGAHRPGRAPRVILPRVCLLAGSSFARPIALSPAPPRAVASPSRLRPVDMARLVAGIWKLRGATGWSSQMPPEQALGDLLASWRERVATGQRAGGTGGKDGNG
jgi:hypothetical protein